MVYKITAYAENFSVLGSRQWGQILDKGRIWGLLNLEGVAQRVDTQKAGTGVTFQTEVERQAIPRYRVFYVMESNLKFSLQVGVRVG